MESFREYYTKQTLVESELPNRYSIADATYMGAIASACQKHHGALIQDGGVLEVRGDADESLISLVDALVRKGYLKVKEEHNKRSAPKLSDEELNKMAPDLTMKRWEQRKY